MVLQHLVDNELNRLCNRRHRDLSPINPFVGDTFRLILQLRITDLWKILLPSFSPHIAAPACNLFSTPLSKTGHAGSVTNPSSNTPLKLLESSVSEIFVDRHSAMYWHTEIRRWPHLASSCSMSSRYNCWESPLHWPDGAAYQLAYVRGNFGDIFFSKPTISPDDDLYRQQCKQQYWRVSTKRTHPQSGELHHTL